MRPVKRSFSSNGLDQAVEALKSKLNITTNEGSITLYEIPSMYNRMLTVLKWQIYSVMAGLTGYWRHLIRYFLYEVKEIDTKIEEFHKRNVEFIRKVVSKEGVDISTFGYDDALLEYPQVTKQAVE